MTYTRGATWPKAATERIHVLEEQILRDTEARERALRTLDMHRRRAVQQGKQSYWETFPWATPEGHYILQAEHDHIHATNPTKQGLGDQRLAEIDAELEGRAVAKAARRGPGRFTAGVLGEVA